MRVTILGLSITSSWGNGHATNYRALVRALDERGDAVTFLERERSWYAEHRDLPEPPGCRTVLYESLGDLVTRWADEVSEADLVIVGSFVPDGSAVIDWVLDAAQGPVAFYDIDTPITLEKLAHGDAEYLRADQVERFDLYLSFTAGPVLESLRANYGAHRPEPFYCFVDPAAYPPLQLDRRWCLNYLGTYSPGRQPTVERLLFEPARRMPGARFAIAGPMYPPEIAWPENVDWAAHLAPPEHPGFYGATDFTLNVTRPEMRATGWAPSVRLFEAAACGVPVISDRWPGLETIFEPGAEILLADGAADVIGVLETIDADEGRRIGAAARQRVLAEHTAERRAATLHRLAAEAVGEAVR
jgi:spore maturation protein CgeB